MRFLIPLIALLLCLSCPVVQAQAPAASPSAASSVATNVIVWVNTASGVYHMPGKRWYGKTKNGKYMKEEDAIKAGYRRALNGQ